MSLGSRLRTIREARNMSQSEVSAATGLSQSYISSIENDQRINVSKEALKKIAKSLNVPPDSLTHEDAALPPDFLDLPFDIATWAANKKNIDYLVFAKNAQEEGFTPEEVAKFLEFYRLAIKGK